MGSVTRVDTSKGRRWRARYRAPDGKSREKWFEKRVDAERFLTSIEHTKLTGAYVDPRAGKITFRDYAEQWRSVQAHRPGTAKSVESVLRLYAHPVLGDRPIGAIQRSEVQAWVKGVDKAPGTVHLTYRYVVAIFRSAVEDQVIPVTPCRRIALPEKAPKRVTIPTLEQVSTMVDSAPERYRALLLLAAASGLRQGELLGLTVDRVDWLRRTITVDRQLAVTGPETFSKPKTAASYRTVPVPAEVLGMLTEHRRRWCPAVHDEHVDELLFTTEARRAVRRSEVSAFMRPAVALAGLPPRTGMHALRHFYASALIHYGESVKVVQERLGHATATETLNTYAHLWPDSEDRTRAAVSEALVGLWWGQGDRQAL